MVCKRDYGEPLADMPDLSEPDDIGQCSVGPVAPAVSVIQVQGRLREHAVFWLSELEGTAFIAAIVTEGYRLPFMRMPDPVCQLHHASFVRAAIDELVFGPLCSGMCTSPHAQFAAHFQWLLMLKASRGKCWSPSSLFCRGDFFSTFDLKSGYHHLDIYQDCWDSPGVLASRGNGTCFGCCPLVCPQLAMCLPSCYGHWLQGGDLRALRCMYSLY